jgi:uncharacterized protein DUF1573
MNRQVKFTRLPPAFSVAVILFVCQLTGRSEVKGSEKLTERVTEFYTAVRANQIDKAAQYVMEKTRDNFKVQSHGKFLGFEITHIEMEQGGQSAIVELSFKVLIPTIFRQIYIPDRTRWKLVSGEWFYDPEDVPPQLGEKLKEYYFDKHPAPKVKSSNAKDPATASKVLFERDLINVGLVEKGKVLNLRFPFTNQSAQEIKIEEFYFRAPFLKSTTTKTVFKPGEKGEISVDLDTSELIRDFDHSFFVEFQPIKEMASLRIKGKVSAKQKGDAPKPPATSFSRKP